MYGSFILRRGEEWHYINLRKKIVSVEVALPVGRTGKRDLFTSDLFKLYSSLVGSRDGLGAEDLSQALARYGILIDDPRIRDTVARFKAFERVEVTSSDDITFEQFKEVVQSNVSFIFKTLQGDVAFPDWSGFCSVLDQIFDDVKANTQGKVADYIPQLAKVAADKRAFSVCSVSGQRHSRGDTRDVFGLQSSVKPFTYALACQYHGVKKVHQHIGQEPSGLSFNEAVLNSGGLPHNPMINAGAIMACALLKQSGANGVIKNSQALETILQDISRISGQDRATIDVAMATSEAEEAFRNFQLGYQMLHAKAFPTNTEEEMRNVLQFYFQTCAIEMNVESASILAGTLANGGVNPLSGERVLDTEVVKYTLSLMASCGMYDSSGEFFFNIGLPAKSGVSGIVLVVIPDLAGFAVWSPPLDSKGNSVVGIEFCKALIQKFNFHVYDSGLNTTKINPTKQRYEREGVNQMLLMQAGAKNDVDEVQRLIISEGVDLNKGDYDDRRVLHLAASEGHLRLCHFLLGLKKQAEEPTQVEEKVVKRRRASVAESDSLVSSDGDRPLCMVSVNPVDRWGNTPLDDALRGLATDPDRFEPVVELLRQNGGLSGR
jgi:glutaminase